MTVVTAAAQPVPGPLLTRWSIDVSPHTPHPEHPRPQMMRPHNWHSLNGRWDYELVRLAVTPDDEPAETLLSTGQILVPFPIESALSGCQLRLGPDDVFRYRRTFVVPDAWQSKRVLLHFEAVDWSAVVSLNGTYLGSHSGGYDPFTFDLTDVLATDSGAGQALEVVVADPTDRHTQPRGKQVTAPGGIWYTPTSGIWQSVWLEAVPQTYIKSIRLTPDLDTQTLRIETTVAGLPGSASCSVDSHVFDRDGANELAHSSVTFAQFDGAMNSSVVLNHEVLIPEAHLRPWSPDDPYLYRLRLRLTHGDREHDSDVIESYCAMRKVSVEPDEEGVTRIHLNNEPLFMFGLLDQGYWPDGLYTAPTDEALKFDIEMTKRLGYNMARKHVKVEPARWYYWCDRLGLLVWQDMPSGDASVGYGDGEIERSADSARQFELELKRLIDARGNHPSIVMWVPFNEGWGQYETQRIADWVKQYDPTRLVNAASGWNDVPGVGDVHDIHAYPGPGIPEPETERAAVLGEFGGLGLPLAGHTWQDEKNWGYRSYEDRASLTTAYLDLIEQLRWLIGRPGLSAAVYTQTTDVEIEVNGIMTYDRVIIKFDDIEKVSAANRSVYLPPPRLRTLVRCAHDPGEDAIAWKYTTTNPAAESDTDSPPAWALPGFDDSNWKTGPSGFGTRSTPGAVVNTEWGTSDIWLRRPVSISTPKAAVDDGSGGAALRLLIHHDEDAEVYIDGILAAELKGYSVDYTVVAMTPAASAHLQASRQSGAGVTLAVHCRQTTGGQYIDVGIVEIVEPES
ncbi:MAG: glycoside hydrolase family 2 [Planctomycetes bacterium]|nr:glycoside hydrolase family 2 [Planctomycetota bacterium]NOG52746.1 glycoside hydrolase family 2 [Planctomycetota bacterium]